MSADIKEMKVCLARAGGLSGTAAESMQQGRILAVRAPFA